MEPLTMNELFEFMVVIGVIIVFVQVSLDAIFKMGWYIKLNKYIGKHIGKAGISILVGCIIAFRMDIDILQLLMKAPSSSPVGLILTGAFIGGGSGTFNSFLKKSKEMKQAVEDAKS